MDILGEGDQQRDAETGRRGGYENCMLSLPRTGYGLCARTNTQMLVSTVHGLVHVRFPMSSLRSFVAATDS